MGWRPHHALFPSPDHGRQQWLRNALVRSRGHQGFAQGRDDALQHVGGLRHAADAAAEVQQALGCRVGAGLALACEELERQRAVFQLGPAVVAAVAVDGGDDDVEHRRQARVCCVGVRDGEILQVAVAIAQTGGDHFFTANVLYGQAVSEPALVTQRQQQNIPFGVGIKDDVARRHELSKFGHAERFRKLDSLLRFTQRTNTAAWQRVHGQR